MSELAEPDVRERIVRVTIELLRSGSRESVTTRAVSAAARVQSPTIYRHFGDMRGLLEAAVNRAFADYLRSKASRPREDDPVEDLRRGWDQHLEFGLANPAIYALIYAEPDLDRRPAAFREAEAVLTGLLDRVARAGRLRVGVDQAAAMIHAASVGMTLNLIAAPPGRRNESLSAAMREAVFSQLTAGVEEPGMDGADLTARRAVALKSVLHDSTALTPSETALLCDWLDRLANTASTGADRVGS